MNYYIFRQVHQSRKVITARFQMPKTWYNISSIQLSVILDLYFVFFLIYSWKILRGRQNVMRQSELNLAMTLFSIVLMHILCNILRVILGVLVVTLVGTVQNISLVVFENKQIFLVESWTQNEFSKYFLGSALYYEEVKYLIFSISTF